MVPFSLSVDPRQIASRAVEAGQTLFVCPPKVRAEVRAIFCSGDAQSCMAVLHVPDADVEKLKAASNPSLRKACE